MSSTSNCGYDQLPGDNDFDPLPDAEPKTQPRSDPTPTHRATQVGSYNQSTIVMSQPMVGQAVVFAPVAYPPNYMVLSVIMCVCCNPWLIPGEFYKVTYVLYK